MSWLARLDARAANTARPIRWSYVGLKWFLVVMGALGLMFNFIEKWGLPAAAWFLIAPFVYGVWRAWPTDPPSTLPPH